MTAWDCTEMALWSWHSFSNVSIEPFQGTVFKADEAKVLAVPDVGHRFHAPGSAQLVGVHGMQVLRLRLVATSISSV